MIISSFQKWAEISGSCECCAPEYPGVSVLSQSASGEVNYGGSRVLVDGVVYMTVVYTFAAGTRTRSGTITHTYNWAGDAANDTNVVTITDTAYLIGAYTTAGTGPIGNAEFASGVASLIGLLDWDVHYYSEYTAGVGIEYKASSATKVGGIVAERYRWAISPAHTGSYCLIEWDMVRSGDPTILESHSVVWTGPGDPEDPDSWLTDWFDNTSLLVAAASSMSKGDLFTFSIANARYKFYESSRLGNKWVNL